MKGGQAPIDSIAFDQFGWDPARDLGGGWLAPVYRQRAGGRASAVSKSVHSRLD